MVGAGTATRIQPLVADPHELDSVLAALEDGPRLVIVRAVIDDPTAAQLEDAGIAYVDAAGQAWFPGWRRTRRSRASGKQVARVLRAPGVRLAQLLADYPGEWWTERELAERGETTQVTAHALLSRLEHEGLVDRASASGGRVVRDAALLRRWLAHHARPTRTHRLAFFVPDPYEISNVDEELELVLTGSAAAERLGLPVVTLVRRPLYRVAAAGEALEAVPASLGGFRTDQGANAILVSDPGRLAALDARQKDGMVIAPPSRVMLDLYLEPRGEAAAEVFLDLWGGKEIE